MGAQSAERPKHGPVSGPDIAVNYNIAGQGLLELVGAVPGVTATYAEGCSFKRDGCKVGFGHKLPLCTTAHSP